MSYQKPNLNNKYDNYINGQWAPPINGEYFDNTSPVDGSFIAKIARSSKEDVDVAVAAAWKAAETFNHTSATERSLMLNKIADIVEENLEYLATVETWDNGKAIRETLNADMPLAVDHFRYFASVIRAETGEITDLDSTTVSQQVYEPLGVVGQIIPWNFPFLMAVWKLAPALAAGNCVVLKPAEQTPVSISVFMELIRDVLPAGVVNIVHGFGPEAGKPLATHPDIKKIAFTGETTTGRLIMQYAAQNIVPVTLELGGKSPNIFFDSVMAEDDGFLDKAVEGFVLFALNQGEVCTCPSRALVQENIYDAFMERVIKRVEAIKMGDVYDPATMMGAQASNDQYEKIQNYLKIGKEEGAELLVGGDVYNNPVYPNGYFIQPTVFKGNNKMRIFQEEIFGPVVCVTTFKDEDEALELANDTLYGLGAGVWTRNIHQMHKMNRGIKAGRIWCNCYHLYPAGATFGGYKQSGIGRENHKVMLDHYRQNKNVLVSYSEKPMGFF